MGEAIGEEERSVSHLPVQTGLRRAECVQVEHIVMLALGAAAHNERQERSPRKQGLPEGSQAPRKDGAFAAVALSSASLLLPFAPASGESQRVSQPSLA